VERLDTLSHSAIGSIEGRLKETARKRARIWWMDALSKNLAALLELFVLLALLESNSRFRARFTALITQ
jgi:hypothetical protein